MRHSLETRSKSVELFIISGSYQNFLLNWSEAVNPPSYKSVKRWLKSFRERHEICDKKRSGRRRLRDEAMISAVGAFFHSNKEASLNTFVEENNDILSRTTVWRILKKDLNWRPYRPRRVHKLKPGDNIQRYHCMDYFLRFLKDDPSFLVKIVWSDECLFKLNGSIVTNNVVYWAEENPHYTYERSTNRNGVMVFAAISHIGLITLNFFDETVANTVANVKPNSVNKRSYAEMIEVNLIPNLFAMLPDTNQIYFMQDGASSHRIPNILNQYFHRRWIGNTRHGAPMIWPSRSPDLTPMGSIF